MCRENITSREIDKTEYFTDFSETLEIKYFILGHEKQEIENFTTCRKDERYTYITIFKET